METRRREFIEDLELAQSYGQIDNTTEDRKETLIQIIRSSRYIIPSTMKTVYEAP